MSAVDAHASAPVPRIVVIVARALIALAVVLRAWVLFAGYFYWDDFILAGRSARFGLTDPAFLFYNHDGHFMPGGFALTWLLTTVSPYGFELAAAVLLIGQAVVWWLWYRLLMNHFGPRGLMLLPLALVLFSPLAMPSGVWWAAAVNFLPLQAGLVVAASAALRWSKRPTVRDLLVMTACTAITLLFFEKAILIAPFVALLLWVVAPTRGVRARIAADGRVWCGQLAVVALYGVTYTALVPKRPMAPSSWEAAGELVARALGLGVAPALLGGPWSWQPVGFASAIADPPSWLVWVALELVLVIVVATAWARPRAARAWLMAAVYVLLDLVLVVAGRLEPLVSPMVAQGLRYTADAAIPIALALALATMALRGEREPLRVRRVRRWAARQRPWGWVVLAVILDVLVTSSMASTVTFRQIWKENPARAYMVTATTSLGAADPVSPLLPQSVPEAVLYPLAFPYNQTDWVLAPLRARPRFADETARLRLLDPSGQLRDAEIAGPSAMPGPVPGCGWAVRSPGGSVPMQTDIIDFAHTMQLGYLASADTPVVITLGNGQPVQTHLTRGVGRIFLRIGGGGTSVTFGGLAAGVGFCTNEVIIGEPTIPKTGSG